MSRPLISPPTYCISPSHPAKQSSPPAQPRCLHANCTHSHGAPTDWTTGPDGPRTLCGRCGKRYVRGELDIYMGSGGVCSASRKDGSRRAQIMGFRTRVKGGRVVRDFERPVVRIVEEEGAWGAEGVEEEVLEYGDPEDGCGRKMVTEKEEDGAGQYRKRGRGEETLMLGEEGGGGDGDGALKGEEMKAGGEEGEQLVRQAKRARIAGTQPGDASDGAKEAGSGDHGEREEDEVESLNNGGRWSHAQVVAAALYSELPWPVEARVRYEGQARRLRIGQEAEFTEVLGVVCQSLGVAEKEVLMKYVDEEGELVTVESDADLREMWGMVRVFGLLPVEMRLCRADEGTWKIRK